MMKRAWQAIDDAPRDGRQVWVRRVHERRTIAEGWAVFGEWHPDAEYVQPDPEMDWNIERAKAERRWLRPDRMYAFPQPTQWSPNEIAP